LGAECALCRHPFAPGDEIIICPEDGARHHAQCWQANGDSCTNYGCTGSGPVVTTGTEQEIDRYDDPAADETESSPTESSTVQRPPRSKVRVLPSSSLGCAQSCLLLSIAIAILLIAVGCFGLWSIADYVLLEVLDWQYRAPLSGALPSADLLVLISPGPPRLF
jgi:hypothetical protein